MRFLPLLILAVVSACSTRPAQPLKGPKTCLSTREYITTMEFLREQKDFALNEKQSRDLASKVSSGCTGASKRFIHVTKLLVKAGLPSQQAIETGTTFALGDDQSFEAFKVIFKNNYLESLLDLDLSSSLNIATQLSSDFKGNKKLVEREFSKLVDFCVNKKKLDLPLMDCAKTAARVVKSSEDFEFKVGTDFIDVFEFVTDKDHANIPTFQALNVAEAVVKFGPEAKNNFIRSYEYGVSKNGLGATNAEAIEFGKTMASKSFVKEEAKTN